MVYQASIVSVRPEPPAVRADNENLASPPAIILTSSALNAQIDQAIEALCDGSLTADAARSRLRDLMRVALATPACIR